MSVTAAIAGATDAYADLDEVRLHYVEAGEGPVVVLLHGFPDFWYSWRKQIQPLAEAGLRVVAPDMRGYNLSDKPTGVESYAIDRLTKDAAELIAHFGEDKAHVIGHDWGAIVSWHLAMAQPHRVDRLGILNVPHPSRFIDMAKSPVQALRSWYVAFFQVPALPEAVISAADFFALRRVFRTEPSARDAFDDEDIEAYVEAARRADSLRGPINYYRALSRRNPLDLRRDRRVIEHEVLVLWGEQDAALGSEFADPDPELVPNARVVRFPDAGHWVHVEQPDEVNRELINFLTT
ncbi:MAG: alpha/beta hydrolase [Actinomycetota bacterium]|nr:alpha/beta hydrolase [Actinomycetota bacterium]